MTDASGVPTNPDNIPTYNTSADAPSGLGFNTAMAQLQSIITNLKAGTLASGKILMAALNATGVPGNTNFLRGDGAWITSPTITTSTLAGGPPGSPKDGDIWIATAVDANGTRWAFQFNTGSASAFKWEFIGGPPIETNDGGIEISTTSAAFVEADTLCRITVARAGDYIVRGSGRLKTSTTSNTLAQAALGTTGTPGITIIGEARVAIAAQSSIGYAGEARLNGATAGITFCQGIRNGSADGSTIAYAFRTMSVTPARIS